MPSGAGKIHLLDEAPHKAYIDLCRKQSLVKPPRFDEIQVVFTPLHGVGGMTALEVLVQQGFRVKPVEEQMSRTGSFRTSRRCRTRNSRRRWTGRKRWRKS